MAAQNNAPLPDGMALGGYRIVKKIASGGFSIVYLAYDDAGNAVAIKEYLPSALASRQAGELAPVVSKSHLALFRIGLKCFFEEGRALARIAHPNVVSVLNFFRANDTVYMVMAYASGQTLQEYIGRQRATNGGVGEAFLRHTFTQVLKGLREVHAGGLLHLDLKPANIYLRSEGTPMLLDFGAARRAAAADVAADLPMDARTDGQAAGPLAFSPMSLSPISLSPLSLSPMYTPGFAAPELYARAETLGPWTDVYGIGAAMFACMAGAPPQPADQRRRDDRMAPHFDLLAQRYSPPLVALVRQALALDPLARPQSLFALQKALQLPAPMPLAPRGLQGLVRRLSARLCRPGAAADTLQP